MEPPKIELNNLSMDFHLHYTEEGAINLPLLVIPEYLPHKQPPNQKIHTTRWPHLRWLDILDSSSLKGLEGIHFTPLADDQLTLAMLGLSATTHNIQDLREMVVSRAQFVLEDYCHIPHEKEYWCRLGEKGIIIHEYIIFVVNEEDIFLFLNIFHFSFGLRFSLHPFFPQTLCHYKLFSAWKLVTCVQIILCQFATYRFRNFTMWN